MSRRGYTQIGFTLLELMIVIVSIALIAMVIWFLH
jgi:Tfp pilus assembly protein FimT